MSDEESSQNSEDAEMQAKIAAFLEGQELSESEPEDDDSGDGDLKALNVPDDLPQDTVDYIVLGANDIKIGRKVFEEMTGLKTGNLQALCGGAGTKSVLCALDNNTFVEITAPDGSSDEGTAGDLKTLPDGELVAYHYAVRMTPERLRGHVPDSSWQLDQITMIGTGAPSEFDEGESTYKWDFVLLYGHKLGGTVPSFINWRENKAHPTCRLEDQGAKLKKVSVRVPEGDKVLGLLEGIGGIKVSAGKPKLTFELETPKGTVKFSGKKPKGIVMPGFKDDSHQSYNK
eukprot:scaffold12195_cov126-Cylindrotheca_fusiformis.AAC.8